jgi:hypothetical protein
MKSLMAIISSAPQHAKEAASALADIGEAIHALTTAEETTLLIESILSQDVNVRRACLQALQVGYLYSKHQLRSHAGLAI